MPTTFRACAPDQSLLFPPSPRDWLPEGHLAFFIADTVAALDLQAFYAPYEGDGRRNQPFDPQMMVTVLLYAYATGTFSSRRIARKLEDDVAYRVLAAGSFPAHRTIAEFRQEHLAAFEALFVQVVAIAREAGVVHLGALVSCPRSSFAESADLVQDDIGGRGPDERRAVLVVVGQVVVNGRFKRRHTLEGTAANPSSGDRRKEAFHLIEPTRTRRREMQVVARMAHEPPDDLRRFVRPVVVHDHMDISVRGQLRIDALEEFQKLLMPMAAMTVPDDLAGRDFQGGEQGGGPVANVVMGLAGRDPGPHRQERSRAIQRLYLTFFVQRQHDGAGGRAQIQPDNVAHLLHELGVGRQFERVEAVRLQPERLPDPPDRRLRQPRDIGETARRPLRGVGRWAFERAGNHVDDLIVGRLARCAGARFVRQPRQAAHAKPLAPLAHAIRRCRYLLGHRTIRHALRTAEYDARAQRQPLRCLRPAGPLLQRTAFILSQHQRLVMAFSWHSRSVPARRPKYKTFSGTRH